MVFSWNFSLFTSVIYSVRASMEATNIYMLFGAVFISVFFKGNFPGANEFMLWPFVIMIACISIATLFSIYRFRKGEM